MASTKERWFELVANILENEDELCDMVCEGFDVNTKNADGETAVDVAMSSKCHSPCQVSRLLSIGGAPSCPGERFPPLYVAACHGDLQQAWQLIQAGADVNCRVVGGFTPLMAAVAGRHLDLAVSLLQAGADVNACTDYGTTALDMTAQPADGLDEAALYLLLEHGADASSNHGHRVHVLHVAAVLGRAGAVCKLVAAGADVDVTFCLPELGRWLFWDEYWYRGLLSPVEAYSADLDLYWQEWSAVILAAACGHQAVVEALVRADAVLQQSELSAVYCAVARGHLSVLRVLAGAGVDLAAACDDRECTALHVAAMHGKEHIVGFLLASAHGVLSLNAVDESGCTPVWWAAREGRARVVQQLLAAGASANAADIDGVDPLFAAVRSGSVDTVEVLLPTWGEDLPVDMLMGEVQDVSDAPMFVCLVKAADRLGMLGVALEEVGSMSLGLLLSYLRSREALGFLEQLSVASKSYNELRSLYFESEVSSNKRSILYRSRKYLVQHIRDGVLRGHPSAYLMWLVSKLAVLADGQAVFRELLFDEVILPAVRCDRWELVGEVMLVWPGLLTPTQRAELLCVAVDKRDGLVLLACLWPAGLSHQLEVVWSRCGLECARLLLQLVSQAESGAFWPQAEEVLAAKQQRCRSLCVKIALGRPSGMNG